MLARFFYSSQRRTRFALAALACAAPFALAAWARHTPAEPGPLHAAAQAAVRIKVVGSMASLGLYEQTESLFWEHELPRLSGGRYGADILPLDKAGVPAVEMLRLLQLGVVPFGAMHMPALAAQHTEYGAPDLAGLNPDMASLRASVAAFRPYLQRSLREQHGVELLAIYTYPAQVLHCQRPVQQLADVAGRRVRVASATQADLMKMLNALPLRTEYNLVMASVQAGQLDCVVTHGAAAQSMGLYRFMPHVYPLPINWGLLVFGANQAAWQALPVDMRALLRRELPLLEERIWQQAARQSDELQACSAALPACQGADKPGMHVARVAGNDTARLHELLLNGVLPLWIHRCTIACGALWQRTIGPVRGIAVPQSAP